MAKLCDFGDCRTIEMIMTPSVGTISYMAPEMIKGNSYTNKIDVYSYGILLWEMITRSEPFGDEMYIHVVCFLFFLFLSSLFFSLLVYL